MGSIAASFQQVFVSGSGELSGLKGLNSDLAVSPDGQQVFVASAADDALVVLDRDPSTGALAVQEIQDSTSGASGLDGAAGVAVSSDGRQVFVGGANDNALAIFDRDPNTGAIAFREAIADNDEAVNGFSGASRLTVSPNGRQVFVVGKDEPAVAVFDRHPASGTVAFRESFFNNPEGISSLAGAKDIAIGPDGQQVFVTSSSDSALVVFDRDPSTGTIAFREAFFDDSLGLDGLGQASGIAVSPDNRHVFVASKQDNALTVFDRDPATGNLAFQASFQDDRNGVDGLQGAVDVAIGTDGQQVFVASELESTNAIFNRDTLSGALTFQGTFQATASGLDRLTGAVVSPNGQQLLATSQLNAAFGAFRLGELTPNSSVSIQNIGETLRVFEGATADRYELRLGTQPAADVTIDLTAATGLEIEPRQVTFTPENWNQPQTVTVIAPDNAEVSGDRALTLSHTVTSDDLGFDSLAVPDLNVRVVDDDTLGLGDGLANGSGFDTTLTARAEFAVLSDRNDRIQASSGNDDVRGFGGNDRLLGSGGADRLYGGAGDDMLSGDLFSSTLLGAVGRDNSTDLLFGGAGNDFLFGGDGADLLFGQRGDDQLEGGAGRDVLSGGDGNDELFGGAGDDILSGGAGDDIFILGIGFGRDTIEGFSALSDRINLTGGLSFEQLQIAQTDTATAITDTQTGQTLAILTETPSSNVSEVVFF